MSTPLFPVTQTLSFVPKDLQSFKDLYPPLMFKQVKDYRVIRHGNKTHQRL